MDVPDSKQVDSSMDKAVEKRTSTQAFELWQGIRANYLI